MPSSSTQLAFAIRAMNESQAALNRVKDDLQGITDTAERGHGKLGSFGSSLSNVAQIAGGFVVAQGLVRLPGLLTDMVQSAADDEQSMNRLKQAVENTGVSFDSFSGALEKSVTAAQAHAFTDDAARSALSLLMAQTGDADEAMRRFALAQDVARGAAIPLETASRLLGKVTEDNVEVFKKMGITIGEGATEVEAMAALQEKFAGQADTYANSTAGQFEKAKIQMGELKERIGYQLLPVMAALGTALNEDVIPAFNKLGDWMELHVIPLVNDLAEVALPILKDAFAQLQQTIEGLQPVADAILKFFEDNPVAIAAVAVALGVLLTALFPIPAAIVAVTAAGTLLLANWDAIREKVTELVTKFQADFPILWAVVELVWNDIQNKVGTVIYAVKAIIDIAMALIHGNWSEAWNGIRTLVSTIFDGIVTDLSLKMQFVGNVIMGAIPVMAWAASELGKAIANAIAAGFKAAWNAVAGAINSAIPNEIGINVPGVDMPSPVPDIPGVNASINLPDNPLPMLAQGGIVYRPTLALIGEAGPEAVVPLTGPHSRSMGGWNITINISAIDGESVRRIVPTIAAEIQRHLRSQGAVGMLA